MKKSISIIAVLCLLLGAIIMIPSFGLADGLRVPAGSRTIYTEWKIWEDGVPVTIEDGGPYKLGGGKTGTSIVISGLSAVGGKCSGDLYLYSPKKNEFEKKKANAEKDKDRIRLAFPDVLENTPYQFSLPRTSTKVLFPTVWVCMDGMKGNPLNQVFLDVNVSETETIRIWSDHYETLSGAGQDEQMKAAYDPDGKLIEAEYYLHRNDNSYHYFYRRKAAGYGRYDIVMDEIYFSGNDVSLKWKDGVWGLRWGLGEPDESSIPKDIDFDPCKVEGNPITMEISSDPEDSSWMAPVDLSKGIPACIPDIANTPLLPYVRFDKTEDGSSRLTLEGLYYWGVQEDELCEWTRFDTFDPGNLSDEELEIKLEESGIDPLEWRTTGERSAEHLLTAVVPAETKYNPDWFGLNLHRKNGTELNVYYEPEYGFDLSATVGDVEYSFHDGESELGYITEEGRSVNADYDQTDGRLIRYEVYMQFPDGASVSYTHERNDDAGEPEYRLKEIYHWQEGQYTSYSYSSNKWRIYRNPGDEGETESLPEELAEICTPIPVIFPDAE